VQQGKHNAQQGDNNSSKGVILNAQAQSSKFKFVFNEAGPFERHLHIRVFTVKR
jgi:hypothetical protein